MSSLLSSGSESKPVGRLFRGVLGLALAWLVPSQALRAEPGIQTEGGVTTSIFSGTIVEADFDGTSYGSVTITGTGNEPASYTLVPFFSGAYALSGTSTPGMVQLTTNSGGIFNESGAGFLYQNAAGAEIGTIGNGAIRLISQPATYEPSKGMGGDIIWNGISATLIEVQGNGATTTPALSDALAPPGFRMAQLSGIAAVSYGDQTVTSGTIKPGGNVTINASGTTTMSNTDPAQITAGVSAASANGTGTTYGDNGPSSVTTTLTNGLITNSAQAGTGMMAVATGAQFLPGTSDVAYGGNVTAGLTNSTISLTGTTGIGIYAVSEVYVASEPPKNSTVQSGTVGVSIGQGSTISTGTTGSVFSIGVLAIGAGSDLFLSPFTSQQVNGHGVGNAGAVTMTNSGAVTTTGTLSAGLAGMSIGGGGIVTTNSGTVPDSYLGNSGGSTNGAGDAVTITNDGTVTTVGANAYGVVALSSGGGGLLNNEIEAAQDVGLVVGNASSSSGSASNGGHIQVINSGTITTGDGEGTGVASMGVVAQSIGGAGGNAGGDHAAFFVGDAGGAGGSGGEVDVTLNAGSLLRTKDQNSIGILAQSIGGGGGNGANAKGLFVAVGGNGGAGGDGGLIDIGVNGALNTQADHSTGVIAQSVGGGGGHGGSATEVGAGIGFGMGGRGGTGGSGGVVTGTLGAGGAITTTGNNSTAMHLQSVGGGGGTGGAASSYTAPIGDDGAHLDISLAVGGSGGEGGLGGAISGTNSGVITTGVQYTGTIAGVGNPDGADSYGMLAQSVGGGGGHGGLATAKSLSFRLSGSGSATDTVTGTTSLGVTLGASVGVGGSGGKGVDGGAVDLNNLSSVTTYADGSHAMIAQSIGGGGGTGGDSTATSTLGARSGLVSSLNLTIGGAGGKAGAGGAVIMTTSGGSSVLHTYGQDASGMVAQSIGGGGGNGGVGNGNLHSPYSGSSVGSGTTPGTTADVLALTLSLGGDGGGGGNAGYSEAANSGAILTEGSNARGIVAQSIGGGGGFGGGGSTDGSNNKITINLSLGGQGGAAGSASGTNSQGYSVAVSNTGSISTSGNTGAGIVAQSIGGGGGAGGNADAQAGVGAVGSITNLLFSSTSYSANLTLGAAIAGNGGGGGKGGAVLVDQSGTVETQGFQAMGVLAQSISGGGGQGGTATAATNPGLFDVFNGTYQFGAIVAVGGQGGDGHDGGSVTVNVAGQTITGGYGAHAVVAQSIAGGGGHGADGTADVSSSLGLGASVGQVSGTMGEGGTVVVTQTANIATAGSDAAGIVAQSISAGGGIASTGQNRRLLSVSPSVGILPVHLDLTLGVNLDSDDQANGGAVTINSGTFTQTSAPQVSTQGDFSHGMAAQTIGAGGGKASSIFGTDSVAYADFSGTITQIVSGSSWTSGKGITLGAADGHGAGGTVNINLVNTAITTGVSGSTGYGAYGILAQSIGGGGGLATVDTAAANGLVWLGGTSSASGVGGHGGEVNFDGGGSVTTHGDAAHGMVMQSIGGGGGVAIIGSSREFSGTAPSGQQVDMTLGSHNSFGLGNAVYGNLAMNIQTSGDQAFGLVAQSIGGGGGIATSQQSGAITLGMQASGTDAYDGGSVDIGGSSLIVTSGVGSHGIVAQSIGGGGGITNPSSTAGLTTSPAVTNSGTALGYGGAVDVIVGGTIQTTGAGAYGVVAQSISGGGGLSGSFAGSTGGAHSTGSAGSGTAGNVTVGLSGPGSLVSASGTGSTAIFAQNATAGASGAGSVSLSIGGSAVGGTGSNAYGVWVDGGNSGNAISVLSGGVVQASSLQAINYTGSGVVDVTNYGSVYGSVSLSDTSANKGVFTNDVVGGFFAEGDINATVNDSGSLYIGTDNSIGATATFSGAYTQYETGTIVMDVFSLGNHDQMLFEDGGVGVFGDEIWIQFADTYVPQINDTFLLIGASGGATPNTLYSSWFTDTNNGFVGVTGLSDGVEWLTTGGAGGSYSIIITAVPEPGAALLILLGASSLLLRRMRRRGN